MMERNDLCWCGSGKKWKKCHYPRLAPMERAVESLRDQYLRKWGIHLKTPEETEGIRRACQLASQILDEVCAHAKAGITTNELNALAVKLHLEAGAKSAPLGYGSPPFPKSICTSLNEVICHGIPDDRPLVEGDILNIDVTSILHGYYGDCSKMVAVGKISEEKERVIRASYQALTDAGAIVQPGVMIYEIGEAIEKAAAMHRCSVVYHFVAHGVGVDFHEPPQIPHHRNRLAIPLAPGMIFTIEPMINIGRPDAVIDPVDKWTARTIDKKPSAQFEHTFLITEEGKEVLTCWRYEPPAST